MKAFLKRRWILLSCAVVLVVCSCIDIFYGNVGSLSSWGGSYFYGRMVSTGEGGKPGASRAFGIVHGDIILLRDSLYGRLKLLRDRAIPPGKGLRFSSHSPTIGKKPEFHDYISLPIWMPLSVILGWIVFRELRWREKRSKAGDV